MIEETVTGETVTGETVTGETGGEAGTEERVTPGLPVAPLPAELTPAELVAAGEENLFALFRAMAAALPGGELVETHAGSRHLAFPRNPMFKGVWRSRLDADAVDAAIEETIAWFQERDAPFFYWWLGPQTLPADLGARLAAHGLISTQEQQQEVAPGIVQGAAGAPVMVADLRRMNVAVLEQTPPGFAIEEIRSEAALLDFKRVFTAVYEVPDWAGQAWVDAALHAGIGNTPWRMFLGRLNGEPVATNILFNGGGVAGVYAVGTVAQVRGQGIGSAITLKPLLEAAAAGYRYAALISTELGIGAYRRIGFHLTEARVNRYLWRNQ